MNPISYYSDLIEDQIKGMSIPTSPASLYEPIKYMMGMGGKRIRPVLTLIANELFGGKIEQAIKPALAMEVFHNFTLVHDDIMDRSPLRRGSPTVHEKWNEETAILSGDVMLVLAYELLADASAEKLHAILKLFNTTAKKVCEGQQLDMIYENTYEVSLEQYIDMVGKKTGALFAGSLKLGAILAGSTAENAGNLYRFGHYAGIAFQVQDDLLDVYGETGYLGKKIGGDIVSNKKTFLAVKALELAEGSQRENLRILNADKGTHPQSKIAKTVSIFDALSIKQHAEAARDMYFATAMHNLEETKAKEEDKQILRDLAETLINRGK